MDNPDELKSEKPISRRHVMQVVEVADDETPIAPPVEEPKHFEYPEEAHTNDQQEEDVVPDKTVVKDDSMQPEKQKEVVSELFKKPETSFGYPSISTKKKTSPLTLILWVFLMIVVIAIIGVILFMIKSNTIQPQKIFMRPTPTVFATPTTIMTPTPAINKKDITIQVLNGSGKSGVATTVKKILEEKGYTVAETGNAKKYDYAKTEIYVKPGNESYLDLLSADLTGAYVIGSTSATLETKASYSARIIIGKE